MKFAHKSNDRYPIVTLILSLCTSKHGSQYIYVYNIDLCCNRLKNNYCDKNRRVHPNCPIESFFKFSVNTCLCNCVGSYDTRNDTTNHRPIECQRVFCGLYVDPTLKNTITVVTRIRIFYISIIFYIWQWKHRTNVSLLVYVPHTDQWS